MHSLFSGNTLRWRTWSPICCDSQKLLGKLQHVLSLASQLSCKNDVIWNILLQKKRRTELWFSILHMEQKNATRTWCTMDSSLKQTEVPRIHKNKHLQFPDVQPFTKRQLDCLYIKLFPPSLSLHHIAPSLLAYFSLFASAFLGQLCKVLYSPVCNISLKSRCSKSNFPCYGQAFRAVCRVQRQCFQKKFY